MPPSLAYRWAFDLCASWSNHAPASVAVLASQPNSQEELIQRLNGRGVLAPPSKSNFESGWTGRDLAGDQIRAADSPADLPAAYALVIWFEPETSAARDDLIPPETVKSAVEVIVVSANGARRFLPEWQGNAANQERHPIPATRIQSLLERQGFQLKICIGMPAPASLAFGFAGGLASRGMRHDAADRFYARMRQTILTRGRLAEYAPLSAMVFRRAA
jgi:hypothetical protein